jgi:hypothetical protein
LVTESLKDDLSRDIPMLRRLGFGICAFWAVVGVIPFITAAFPTSNELWVTNLTTVLQQYGTFGDMFGALTSLCSCLTLIGVGYAIYLQRIEIRLQRDEIKRDKAKIPVLRLLQTQTTESRITESQDACYVRIAVENVGGSVANNCLIYLTDVQQVTENGLVSLGYEDTIRLRWAYEPWQSEGPTKAHEGLALPSGVIFYFNLLWTVHPGIDKSGQRTTDAAIISFNSYVQSRYTNLLKMSSTYLFTFVAAADEAMPVKATWKIAIGAGYKDLDVSVYTSTP